MWFQRVLRKARRALFKTDPDFRDPFDHPQARCYAQVYLRHFDAFLEAYAPKGPLRILDVGANTGRLAVPIAQRGHAVTAVDPSGFALHQARRHAREANVLDRMRFVKSSLEKLAGRFEPFDVVVSTEVLYLIPNPEASLAILKTLAKPRGLLFVSHRPRFYYLSSALAKGDLETARFVKEHSEGTVWGSYYNWQSGPQLRDLYRRVGLEVLGMKPIGSFSESFQDEEGKRTDVSVLSDEAHKALLASECDGADGPASAGNYILVLARVE